MAFQREKQGRLNQVEVVVLLRLQQIDFLQDGQLPEDLSGALLFSTAQLDKLKKRVQVSNISKQGRAKNAVPCSISIMALCSRAV